MRAKFNTKFGNRIYSTQGSSVWAGIRWAVTEVEQRSGWIIGEGKDIDIWRDNSCYQLPLKELINSDSIPWNCLKAKISRGQPDKRIWKPNIHGRFSVKSAFQEIRNKGPLCCILKAADTLSSYLKDLWLGAIWGGSNLIWQARNDHFYEEDDLSIIHCLRVPCHPRKVTIVRSCFWDLLEEGKVKINTDGASKRNLGKGGVGFIIRNSRGAILRATAMGLGNVISYMAECTAFVQGLASAAYNGWEIAWLESDSSGVVNSLKNNLIP
ncbi:hypothetical protein GIB67_023762 [Kingdonia uniflora]|uniref:RNase H type-1 domain-containing protein n=1 Tax=Kingdonia uniflora TaxID=39325 RepID=A0A7J7LGC7_9MAGN|nr:hypothetical protein GIB67_023762 [Kingdonia uniflora]